MYFTQTKRKYKGKEYTQILLRRSDRINGKTVSTTIANLTNEDPNQIVALMLALKNQGTKYNIEEIQQGNEIGTGIVIKHIMDQLSISKVLGKYNRCNIGKFLISARIALQGSRNKAYMRYNESSVGPYLGLKNLKKYELYETLDEFAKNKNTIEDKLFVEYNKRGGTKANLYLYDVTSSYVEGEYEESNLVKCGYNRDKKQGKKQIVFGLLTDSKGFALSGQIFAGNTNDVKTFDTQVETCKKRL